MQEALGFYLQLFKRVYWASAIAFGKKEVGTSSVRTLIGDVFFRAVILLD